MQTTSEEARRSAELGQSSRGGRRPSGAGLVSALHYPVRFGWEAGTRSAGSIMSVGYMGDVDYVGIVGDVR